jgi:hypothetical protein
MLDRGYWFKAYAPEARKCAPVSLGLSVNIYLEIRNSQGIDCAWLEADEKSAPVFDNQSDESAHCSSGALGQIRQFVHSILFESRAKFLHGTEVALRVV